MKNLTVLLIFSILVLSSCTFEHIKDDKDIFFVNSVLKHPYPIIKSEIGNNCVIIVSDSIYIQNNGKISDIGSSINALPFQINDIQCIKGDFYIYTQNGLYIVDTEDLQVRSFFTSNNTLTSDHILDMSSDGKLAVFATTNGVTVHTLDSSYNIQFEKYKEGRMLDGWYSLNSRNIGIPDDYIQNVKLVDSEIFIISKTAISIFNWQSDTFETYALQDVFKNELYTDCSMIHNRVYFSTLNGLYQYDRDFKSWEDMGERLKIDDRRIQKIITYFEGMFLLTPSDIYYWNSFSEFTDKLISVSEFPGSSFTDMQFFKNTLYIATSNGLLAYNIEKRDLEAIMNIPVDKLIKYGDSLYIVTKNEIYKTT